jgi:6-hydroxycyclohex-1-ene-1-carbonyl-CoA dehydrogenase
MEALLNGYEMVEPGAPLRRTTRAIVDPAPGEALVEVAGCGICHTDLGFLDQGVRTRHPMPLILGHEISGVVRAAGAGAEHLVGKPVVVPAVIPCGVCRDCLAGAPMICKKQVFPGNDRDGGWASHVTVPANGLCVVPGASTDFDAKLPGPTGLTLRHLSVIADAVSTPYQAIKRAGVTAGSLVIIVGLGGVGGYAAQIARAYGAHVVGLDVNAHRLESASTLGVGLALDAAKEDPKGLKKKIGAWAATQGAPDTRWVILECSGSAAGQRTAFSLLVHGATLMVVGFTMDTLEVRLSNLMAFDARAMGNWGCAPDLYPELVQLVLDGRIDLLSHTQLRPLDGVEAALADVRAHRVHERLVLVP